MRRALLLLPFVLLGCGKGDFSERATKKGNELRLVYLSDPATFDPAFAQSVENNALMGLVYEGLVGWSEDNRIEPRLAESWTISKDGLTYTFKLRPGLKFSDGSPLTAADIKRTWERNADPANGSPLASGYLGDVVAGSGGWHNGLKGVESLNASTLRVRIDKPRPSFLGKLTYAATFPLAPSAPARITDPKQMIGTGPFVLESHEPNQRLKLKPNPNYFRGKPKLDGLTIRIVGDTTTRLALFKSGDLDVLSLSQQDIPGVKKDAKLAPNLTYLDRAAVVYIGMNGKVYPPFADSHVRRSFVMAVDRDFIVEKILYGVGRRADGILPPSIPQRSRLKPFPATSSAQAKELLREAGWAGKLPPIALWVNASDKDRKTIAEYICSQLKTNLGVEASVRLADNNTIIQKATKRELGFFYGSWYADYLDAENFLSVLLSSYGQNRTNYDNPRFTQLCRLGDVESDETKRLALYAEAEDLALKDCPWIPLYFPQEAVAIQPWVKGLKRNAFGFMPPSAVEIVR